VPRDGGLSCSRLRRLSSVFELAARFPQPSNGMPAGGRSACRRAQGPRRRPMFKVGHSRRYHHARPHRWRRTCPPHRRPCCRRRRGSRPTRYDNSTRGLGAVSGLRAIGVSNTVAAHAPRTDFKMRIPSAVTRRCPQCFTFRPRPLSPTRPAHECPTRARAGLRPLVTVHTEQVAAVDAHTVDVVDAGLALCGGLTGI
jgi:hypothetical protein